MPELVLQSVRAAAASTAGSGLHGIRVAWVLARLEVQGLVWLETESALVEDCP
jgi:hypothetical protein